MFSLLNMEDHFSSSLFCIYWVLGNITMKFSMLLWWWLFYIMLKENTRLHLCMFSVDIQCHSKESSSIQFIIGFSLHYGMVLKSISSQMVIHTVLLFWEYLWESGLLLNSVTSSVILSYQVSEKPKKSNKESIKMQAKREEFHMDGDLTK